MHKYPLAFNDDKRPRRQPANQFIAVGGREDRVERVVAVRSTMPGGDGQQMEVVIAQYGGRGIAQLYHLAQDRERFRAAIHEVTDEP